MTGSKFTATQGQDNQRLNPNPVHRCESKNIDRQDETLLQAKLTRAMIRCELADSREYKAAVS